MANEAQAGNVHAGETGAAAQAAAHGGSEATSGANAPGGEDAPGGENATSGVRSTRRGQVGQAGHPRLSAAARPRSGHRTGEGGTSRDQAPQGAGPDRK